MPPKPETKFLRINDFSQGIVADYRLNSPLPSIAPVQDASKPGAAAFQQTLNLVGGGTQVCQTKGYYANAEGKLVPLPVLFGGISSIPLAALPAGDVLQDVAGFDVVPAIPGGGGAQAEQLWSWLHTLSNTPRDTLRIYRNQTLVKSLAGNLVTAGPPRGITHFLSRGKRSGFATPAGPEFFWEWTSGEPHTDGSVMFYDVWPDPNATNTDAAFEETGVISNAAFLLGGPILPHDGRVLRLCEQFHNFGLPANSAGVYTNERVRYTDPPNSVSLAGTTTDSVLDPQNPNTYGAWGSLTYGELLLIKQYGGALLIEGDVYAPQITRLPSVQSTGAHVSQTAWTSRGLVYMTDDGPYIWEGGSSSQRLGFPAGAILPITGNMAINGGSGITCSVCAFNNLVIFSGGAVWDSIHGNWWALQTPYATNPINYFAASPVRGANLYGITSAPGASGRVEIFYWSAAQAAVTSTGEWFSQPIPVASDTIDITACEISLGAMPSDVADINVSLWLVTIDGALQFCGNYRPNPTNANGQWRFRFKTGVRGRAIQPYLKVFNNNGYIPSVNEMIFEYNEAGLYGRGTQVS